MQRPAASASKTMARLQSRASMCIRLPGSLASTARGEDVCNPTQTAGAKNCTGVQVRTCGKCSLGEAGLAMPGSWSAGALVAAASLSCIRSRLVQPPARDVHTRHLQACSKVQLCRWLLLGLLLELLRGCTSPCRCPARKQGSQTSIQAPCSGAGTQLARSQQLQQQQQESWR